MNAGYTCRAVASTCQYQDHSIQLSGDPSVHWIHHKHTDSRSFQQQQTFLSLPTSVSRATKYWWPGQTIRLNSSILRDHSHLNQPKEQHYSIHSHCKLIAANLFHADTTQWNTLCLHTSICTLLSFSRIDKTLQSILKWQNYIFQLHWGNACMCHQLAL